MLLGDALYPLVEKSEIRHKRIPGFLNIAQLAVALGTGRNDVSKWARRGVLNPDLRNNEAVFFAEDRLQELREKWADRRSSSPVSVLSKGVITQFGVMLPRVRPKNEVLEQLNRQRHKRPSRDSSWLTRPNYNLSDVF